VWSAGHLYAPELDAGRWLPAATWLRCDACGRLRLNVEHSQRCACGRYSAEALDHWRVLGLAERPPASRAITSWRAATDPALAELAETSLDWPALLARAGAT
jgi:hypothetical protein